MPFSPAYNAQFAKPLVNQVIALMQRDQRAALDLVAGTEVLDSLVEYRKDFAPSLRYPALVVVARETSFDPAADPGRRSQTHSLLLALRVVHHQPDELADRAMDYLRALDMVLSTAATLDFETSLPIDHPTVSSGTTTPLATGSMKDVFVRQHDLGELFQSPAGEMLRTPRLLVEIRTEEI